MPKSRFLIAFAVTAFTLTGCSSITDMFASLTGSETWTSENPSGATSSLNRYTDLINDALDQMDYLETDVAYFESDIANYESTNYQPYFTCNFYLYDRENLEYDTLHPTGLEEAESQDLVSQATAIFASIDSTEELCKELSKYVTAEDYKVDDFAQGKTLVAELYTNIDTYREEREALSETLEPLYEKYSSFEVDLTDPISVGIDNMDKDLDLAHGALILIQDAANTEVFDKVAELQSYYDQLELALEAHYGSNAPAIDSAYTYNYTECYNTMEVTFLPTLKRSIRDMENGDIDALTNDYYDILDSYNLMVGSYNYFLDATSY